ncbi:DUF484 family protein [Hylemonella gracilis]|uniref:DUF484 family protein n=1 Tax=Hylemonella gracilis ATCC 19624 TaxID=887062 RepID=F3KQ81_9BURK|nr:DUF484 family protein [Hylemonella gracilis]EGI78048.1 hypothetical protein HGR_02977 [Hylemonella gracilis ATCC 19624]
MTEEEIVRYLRGNPAFFDRNADALAEIVLVSPHSRRTVSLQERQAELLREKIRAFEMRLMELLRHGADNTVLADRLLRWSRDLFLEHDATRVPDLIAESIQQQFAVPQVALRVWGVAPVHGDAPWAQGATEEVRQFADALREPFCGVNTGFEVAAWLPHPEQAVSLALLPLRALEPAVTVTRTGQALDSPATIGLIVLASPDAQRYTSTMGTDFLLRIAEVASAALSRLR